MNKKEKILQTAEHIFARSGFDKTSVDEIAEKANIAKGTIYYHFRSKEEIFYGLMEEGMRKFVDSVIAKVAEIEDPRERLESVLLAQLEYYEKHRDFCRVLLFEFWRLERKWKDNIPKIKDKYADLLHKIIVDGQKSGIFNQSLNVEAATTSSFSLIAVAGLGWAVFHKDIPKATMHQTIVSIFLNGISKN